MKSRMFSFVTKTWNPFVGCLHECSYCWARRMARRSKCDFCKAFVPHFHGERLRNSFGKYAIVFCCDMGDVAFCKSEWLDKILAVIKENPETKFLFLTKDPRCYFSWKTLPENVIFGATIETNRDTSLLSKAPHPAIRFEALMRLAERYPGIPTFISIEPILDFDPLTFLNLILEVDPGAIAIGYDNYNHRLPEPSLEKTLNLIKTLKQTAQNIHEKTLRKAWWE